MEDQGMMPIRTILAANASGRQTAGEKTKILKTRRARRKAVEAEMRRVAQEHGLDELAQRAPAIRAKYGF